MKHARTVTTTLIAVLAVFLSSMLGACIPKDVDGTSYTQGVNVISYTPIPVSRGSKVKSVALVSIVFAIPEGRAIGERKYGLPPVNPYGNATWVDLDKEGLARNFFRILKNHGYNVAGDPDSIFENQKDDIDLFIGARIVNAKLNIYHDSRGKDLTKGKSNAEMTVEWQIFDPLEKATLYTVRTVGTANQEFSGNYIRTALFSAFSNATTALLANPKFHALLVEDDAQKHMAHGTAVSQRFTYATPGTRTPLQDVPKSTVTLQMSGRHGSGFILSPTLVITNAHVIGGASKARVLTHDGRKLNGTVIAKDVPRDVAALIVEDLNLPPLLVRRTALNVGEDVYAVGAPLDISLSGSMTRGIVSGFRTMNKQHWIQSDAAINPGNSGGPLVDAKGNVVGISTLTLNDAQGIFFFGPIEEALHKLGIRGE